MATDSFPTIKDDEEGTTDPRLLYRTLELQPAYILKQLDGG
jgi:hypothetical protein